MKTLLSIVALTGAIALAGATAERWAGSSLAIAQSDETSACLQNCADVRKWPEDQCMEYCKGKTKEETDEEMDKDADEETESKPETEK